ncbi:hypothetical protein [Patulibacter sp. SYSU D01012]|uniref:hypothetical protein n=1 Tax=Patulibacter sp. SYSU D01012 TaxID=2817381 RepID=UPI001B3170E5|nr:hypothetical protein [Patulibacter sp. SYSU D01012]
MVIAIVAAEIAFWVLIALGLGLRYLAGQRRLGLVVLACTPLVDLTLLGLVAWDVSQGGTATGAHALAAVYLGVSVVFGHSMIAWADARVAYRFAGGPKPPGKPKDPALKKRLERRGWLKHAAAWALGCGLLMGTVLLVGDADRTQALTATATAWTVVLAIDAAISL